MRGVFDQSAVNLWLKEASESERLEFCEVLVSRLISLDGCGQISATTAGCGRGYMGRLQ